MTFLKGSTLGERHQHYNELVKLAIEKKQNVTKIDYNKNDVDNMINIDIASHNRDVEFILDVLQCDDTLYVTRAINKSTWLVTEEQYGHIINPTYLHANVFPNMMPKAITKVMLHIRKHLKDENRLKDFYNYVNEKNPRHALKWLPTCSVDFIKKTVKVRVKEIPLHLTKRIGRRSTDILKYIVLASNINFSNYYDYKTTFHESIFLLRNHTEEFLDIFEQLPHDQRHKFPFMNSSTTAIVLKKHRQRIIDNFITYLSVIDLPTFADFIKESEVKDFLMDSSPSSWACFDKLQHFLIKIPEEEILDLLRLLYGISDDIKLENDTRSDAEALFYEIEPTYNHDCFRNIYRWYEFAPFKVAFKDLKKFIYAESSPEERHSMLITMLKSARKNMEHVATAIQYYHEKHINEPYLHKITFVNTVLTQHDAFRFDELLWTKLNELFYSLEVYIESKNKVQQCIHNIIIYKSLRGQELPETVEQKFEFNSLIEFKRKLSDEEQDKLFQCLHGHLLKKLNTQRLNSESSMNSAITILMDLWTLIKDWKKQTKCHKFVIQKIIELCDLNNENDWRISMKPVYLMMKSHQRPLIEKSILLHPCENVLLNILRHNPRIFNEYKKEINGICCNNDISLKRLLNKFRTYWSESLAMEWNDIYYVRNMDKIAGHKATVKGIFILSTHSKILDFVKKYEPNENKINWSNGDETVLSLRKHIAKSMYLSRPPLPTEIILGYAKGDYLQYAIHSLNTIYYNLRSKNVENHIYMLLNAPVSLQKHGIRLAFSKFKTEEFKQLSERIWKSNKNSSIRAVIFKLLFALMCKQDKATAIDSTWKILQSFIDDLNQNENTVIFHVLKKVSEVPHRIIGEFYQKSFLFLKALPPKAECRFILDNLLYQATDYIEYFENDFVENALLGSVGTYSILADNNNYPYIDILSAYLLCSVDENIQLQKYNNLLTPTLENWSSSWSSESEKANVDGLESLLNTIGRQLDRFVFKNKMVMPLKMLSNIKQFLCNSLSVREHYVMLTRWKLFVDYVDVMNDIMISNSDEDYVWDTIRDEATKGFAQKSATCVVNDCNKYFPRLYILFADALEKTINDIDIGELRLLKILKSMLYFENIEVYLTVLKLVPTGGFWGADKEEKERISQSIFKQLYSYPSEELKMYYFQKRSEKYNDTDYDTDNEKSNDEDESDEESGSDNSDTHEANNISTSEYRQQWYCVIV